MDNKNATAWAGNPGTCGIDGPANGFARPEKAADYTQRFAVLQQRTPTAVQCP